MIFNFLSVVSESVASFNCSSQKEKKKGKEKNFFQIFWRNNYPVIAVYVSDREAGFRELVKSVLSAMCFAAICREMASESVAQIN